MLFSSMTFLYLYLPFVLICYYLIFRWSRLLQNIFLLAASLLFYAWGEPKFVFAMMGSILVNWFFGLLVDALRGRKSLCKISLALDVAFNLGILFIFKYLTFMGEVINTIFGMKINVPKTLLPIGISFFTFQAMSYVIDVYRQKAEVQPNLFYVGLYISFFPQLIAGPIVRYETIADQIKNRQESLNGLFDGFARFVEGLSKKVLLANAFAILADQAFNADISTASAAFCWLGAIAYTFQIFFDFSGYSDMAIGLGQMFGFRFLENFDYPYISTSVTEFWRRWHISLGTWFRDYLYIPLGGNRCGTRRNIFNLFIVWFLTGLWHGANYTYIVWGLMYFLLLFMEKKVGINNKSGQKTRSVFKWLYTMFFVVIGWVIFRADSIGAALCYLRGMFCLNGNLTMDGIFTGWFAQNILLLFFGVVLSTPLIETFWQDKKHGLLRAAVLACLFVLSVASLVSSSYNPFIYFNF